MRVVYKNNKSGIEIVAVDDTDYEEIDINKITKRANNSFNEIININLEEIPC